MVKKSPIIPHGISVIVNSPSVFKFTGDFCNERHLKAAEAIGADIKGINVSDGGTILADHLIKLMKKTNIPNGLIGLGYSEKDLDNLTNGAFPQKRLIDNAPCKINHSELKQLFKNALSYW